MPKIAAEAEETQKRSSMDVLYNSDEFRMYCFKVLPCSKHYSHDWTICPFAHPGEKARRRDPRVFKYAGVECPHVKEGLKCPRGDLCPFAHNIFECWLHPTRYRTQLCNEPASCKRKVCFFAHALEELREPSNPIDSLPEGGIGSGTAPLMSLDGLANSGPFCGLLSQQQQQRQSVDVACLQHLGLGTSSPVSLHDLMSNLQGLNAHNQAEQNQQLTQLLINLLAEIDLNGQHQRAQQQLQRDAAFFTGMGAAAVPRWSVDGTMIPMSQYPSLPGNYQSPRAVIPGMAPCYTQSDAPIFNNRSTSMESGIQEAMTRGMACHGRVSVDNAALTRPAAHPHPLPVQKRDSKKLSFHSIVEDCTMRSSEEDSATSCGDISMTESRRTESYPVNFPIDESEARPSLDCTLPESFILF